MASVARLTSNNPYCGNHDHCQHLQRQGFLFHGRTASLSHICAYRFERACHLILQSVNRDSRLQPERSTISHAANARTLSIHRIVIFCSYLILARLPLSPFPCLFFSIHLRHGTHDEILRGQLILRPISRSTRWISQRSGWMTILYKEPLQPYCTSSCPL